MGQLDGKRILVTGAGRGIGKDYAKTLAAEGAHVALADIIDAGPVVDEIRADEGVAESFHVDVSEEASVRRMIEGGRERARGGGRPRQQRRPLGGPAVHAVLGHHRRRVGPRDGDQRQGGVSDVSGGVPAHEGPRVGEDRQHRLDDRGAPASPGFLQYVTSKGAVHGLTRALARELGDFGITVNTLAPGYTLSEKVLEMDETALKDATERSRATRCLKRAQYPADVQGTMLYLASPASDFMTGQLIVVDGGAVMT